VKLAKKKQELFDICLMAVGLGRVAEHTNKLQRCFINVAEFLQICHRAMSFCFVILVWNWPWRLDPNKLLAPMY